MPKLPRLTAKEAEILLLDAGFVQIRSQGSHRIYLKSEIRVVIPFHSGKILGSSGHQVKNVHYVT